MSRLIIATRNKGKLSEFIELLGKWPFEIIDISKYPNIKICEDGSTFEQNAIIKAKTVANATGFPALGDDSGLEVKALNGEPGIYSARYAGPCATDEDNIKKLLQKMKNVLPDQRQARFVCSLALAFPDNRVYVEHGFLEGQILLEARGTGGFGYDPVFLVPSLKKTLAEVLPEQKNRISHRAIAIQKMKAHLHLICQ